MATPACDEGEERVRVYTEQSRPDACSLFETVGYVAALAVEQEGTRDAVRLTLQIFSSAGADHKDFVLYLDGNTTVVVAQLQLLRDALRSRWSDLRAEFSGTVLLVRVRFNFQDESEALGIVYTVGLEQFPEGWTVEQYYAWNATRSDWYRDAITEFPD